MKSAKHKAKRKTLTLDRQKAKIHHASFSG